MITASPKRDLVHSWQRHYGMEPRTDSKLTDLYVEGHLGWMGPDEVARELVATDFLYRETLYGVLLEDFLRGVAAELRTHHPRLSWSATWNIVRFYGPTALKLMVLSSAHLQVPHCSA